MKLEEIAAHTDGLHIGLAMVAGHSEVDPAAVGVGIEAGALGRLQRGIHQLLVEDFPEEENVLLRLPPVHREEGGNLGKAHLIVAAIAVCCVDGVQRSPNGEEYGQAHQHQHHEDQIDDGEMPSALVYLDFHPLSTSLTWAPASMGAVEVVMTKSPLASPLTAVLVSS